MTPIPPPPAEVAWLSGIIGADATLRLVEERGGTSIFVPREVNQASPLAQLVGLGNARRLSEVYGGDYIAVPLLRWWRVRVEKARGLKDREIARKLVMTEGQVSRLLRAAAPPPAPPPGPSPQPDLFGP
ncbi:MAG: hypothetical protein K2X46_11995 [Roseomonas sp.]|nr:hypothetical protein [Roseomonas sp.]